MTGELPVTRGWLYPICVWLVLLGSVFAVEYAVMLILASVLKEGSSRAIDSVVLTLVLAPALWWTIVHPLTEVIRLRTQFLSEFFNTWSRTADKRPTSCTMESASR